jgi:hypothetical protein
VCAKGVKKAVRVKEESILLMAEKVGKFILQMGGGAPAITT